MQAGRQLKLAAPILTWDEAIPLGNGLTGGLLWGEGNLIRLSLDRGDLWDDRDIPISLAPDWNFETIQSLVRQGRHAELNQRFDSGSHQGGPTKIPAGRLEITLSTGLLAQGFTLDLPTATGRVDLGNRQLDAFFSAVSPIALLRIPDAAATCAIRRPDCINLLGYPPPVFSAEENLQWIIQEGIQGLRYAVVVGRATRNGETLLAVTITSTADGNDPLALGKQRVNAALARGYDTEWQPHGAWWKAFWETSAVSVPNEKIQFHYDLVKYFLGAASRRGAPPIPLQGVWTADQGELPPWKGDFHNDLNTQMSYISYHVAGLDECGLSFLDFNWNLLDTYREFGRRVYNVAGAIVPGSMSVTGKIIPMWVQYSLTPTCGLWIAQSFYRHWKFTMDREFLRTRAYPWIKANAEGVLGLLKPDEHGKLKLPLSTSPEIFDNTPRAWLPPNSNYDLALLQWTFEILAELAGELQLPDEAGHWRRVRNQLDELATDPSDNALCFAKGFPYHESHRHFSHAMGIHPLGTMHIEDDDRSRRVIRASIEKIHRLGTFAWCGYSFPWMSCLASRAGLPEMALDYLATFERAFTLRNGFHCNGDQTNENLSVWKYRPFTLEGNLLALEAVHEMLIQSWNGVIRLFPSVSTRWADASFRDLRAEGGYRVSARRENGNTTWFRIHASHSGVLKLRNNFDGRLPQFNKQDVRQVGLNFEVALQAGDILEARF